MSTPHWSILDNSQRLGSCAPLHFSAIFGVILISRGKPIEQGLRYTAAERYWIIQKRCNTTSFRNSVVGLFFELVVGGAGYLSHFWDDTNFPWPSDRGVCWLLAGEDILNKFQTPSHDVFSKIHFRPILSAWSCAPRDFSAIFGTIPISLGNRTEECVGYALTERYWISYKHHPNVDVSKIHLWPNFAG
jgi:hypothetical protein